MPLCLRQDSRPSLRGAKAPKQSRPGKPRTGLLRSAICRTLAMTGTGPCLRGDCLPVGTGTCLRKGCHCEVQSAEAIQTEAVAALDCFAPLAMTGTAPCLRGDCLPVGTAACLGQRVSPLLTARDKAPNGDRPLAYGTTACSAYPLNTSCRKMCRLWHTFNAVAPL
jgi:hypothetical protein